MMPVNQIGRSAASISTIKATQKPAVRFGENKEAPKANPFTEQSPAAAPAKSKGGIIHKAVTGFMAATMGILGVNALQTNSAINQQGSQITQLADSQAQTEARRQALQDKLMLEVTALNGRTTEQSGLSRDRLEAMAKQLADIQSQTASLAGRKGFLTQMVEVVEKVTPSTVQVKGPYGLGSGVIIQDNLGRNFILTNSHVTEDNANSTNKEKDKTFTITLYTGSDNKEAFKFEAAPVVLGNGSRAASYQEIHDLSLLAIPPDVKLPEGVRPVEMRDVRETIRAGEVAVAVGSPLGNRDTVSSGIISNSDKNFDLEPHNRFLMTDTPINPGNSGGGLFDMDGRLIGINTLGYRGADGLGGSIRIDAVKAVLESWGVPVMNAEEKAANKFVVQPNPKVSNDNPWRSESEN